MQSPVAIPGVQTINDNHIGGVFYLDLNLAYAEPVPGTLQLWSEVTNVLDRAPRSLRPRSDAPVRCRSTRSCKTSSGAAMCSVCGTSFERAFERAGAHHGSGAPSYLRNRPVSAIVALAMVSIMCDTVNEVASMPG